MAIYQEVPSARLETIKPSRDISHQGYMNQSEYHKKRSARGREMRIAFAHAYNRLLRERIRGGLVMGGIKLRAAILAGFGKESWSERAAYKTRRVMASKMMRDPVVIQTLLECGLKPHPTKTNEWMIADEQKSN